MTNYDDIKIDAQAIIDEANREPSADYPKISVKGSNKYSGLTKCESFTSKGKLEVEDIDCWYDFNVKGKTRCLGNISAKNIYSKGTFYCEGEISAPRGTVGCFGKFIATKKVKSGAITIFGKADIPEGIEANSIYLTGGATTGVLDARTVELYADGKMIIDSIKGKKIVISAKRKGLKRIPPFSCLVKSCVVNSSIEGESIRVARLTCPLVIGCDVEIGDGCEIELVKYSGKIEISPKAKIGKTEKI